MSDPQPPASFSTVYTEGEYAKRHPDWHLADAPGKAIDIAPAVAAVADAIGCNRLTIADVGAGVGGVLDELMTVLNTERPQLQISPVAFEISLEAATEARRRYPKLDVRQKFLASTDGPFDATMFIDVLEHVENPWALLRTAGAVSRYLIVRQPLLSNCSRFFHDNYKDQREKWGHIGLFNSRSFADMALATGWKPISVRVLGPWELTYFPGKKRLLPRLLVRMNRELSSFVIDGFYLIGAYERA
jgi:hypothetical protein